MALVFGSLIPLAPGPDSLEPMSWAWLTGTPALLFLFIATVIGIPASVDYIVRLARRALSRHPEVSAGQSAPAVLPSHDTWGAVSTDEPFMHRPPLASVTHPAVPINLGLLYQDYLEDKAYKDSRLWSTEGPTGLGVPVYRG